ncbi:RNA polymerase III subunit RPC82 helix-turn-helix domain-containing protein [Lentinula edodes]|uniref:RNA polymerase III subunit RPC82 helix-turn-helix domain-containing protein n=1 Tax=Lentinula edodes TaxID=5353 RepID=UPI001E8D9AA8|nr:RNA polymerase III subunit RPC82 helix-turn-helix domain-containing protein [Lentinula edodes]KAH7877894.1 RNA polymerase III subunit RPC82 helix-turn-helix domain-containing protein [Lentinula edodes]
MADLHTTNLCVQIVSTHFGPLASKIASVLLSHGRLTLPQLVRFTALKPRLVRNILLVLIQQNIIWHANSETDGSGEEVLEINADECLMRLRFGAFVYQAEELFGVAGGEIVQLVLHHGKLTSPQILQRLNAATTTTSFLAGEDKTPVVYSQALHKLVLLHYLKPSVVSSHISPRDKRIQYEAEEKAKISGFPTSKQLREAKETVDARLRTDEEEVWKIGLKRKAKSQLPSTKKRKVTSTKEEDDMVVDETVYFRVNFDKFNIHTRNALIEKAAKERYNSGAALVVHAILKITEESQHSVADCRSDPLSVSNITLHLSSEEDEETLTSGLIQSSSRTMSSGSCIKEYLGILSSADNPTPAGRAGAFLELSSKGGGSGKVQMLFDVVARRLRRQVLEGVARERHGSEGVRVVRLLMDTGKLDEKQISKHVMMPLKDVRPLLSALSASSLVSIVEVPKSADRNPTRMFYLWQVDIPKAFSYILNVLYKTLYNISARRQAEREDPMLIAVLNKRERSDVSVDVEGLLSQHEKEVLKAWEEKQEKLGILEGRVEESVFIVRDLGRAVGSLEEN